MSRRIKDMSDAVPYKPRTMTAEVKAQREVRIVAIDAEIEAIMALIPAKREEVKVWHETDTSGYAYGMPSVELNRMANDIKQLKREKSDLRESIRFVERAAIIRKENAEARKAARKIANETS